MIEKCLTIGALTVCGHFENAFDMYLMLTAWCVGMLLMAYGFIGTFFWDRLLKEILPHYPKITVGVVIKITFMLMFLWLPLQIQIWRNKRNVTDDNDRRRGR